MPEKSNCVKIIEESSLMINHPGMTSMDINFHDVLETEIEVCRKLKNPTWLILFQVERKPETTVQSKSEKKEDWVDNALKDLTLWSGMIKYAGLYGFDKIAIVPNTDNASTTTAIADQITEYLTVAKQKYAKIRILSDPRKVVYSIVAYDPFTRPDKTADHLLEEALELLWLNRLC